MTLKQVFIINKDLKMGAGKIAVQVAHGEVLFMESIMGYSFMNEKDHMRNYHTWRERTILPIGVMTKIVLKASENEMNSLCEIMNRYQIKYFKVFDLGKTQVEPNSFSCICTEPICDWEIFRHLKLA